MNWPSLTLKGVRSMKHQKQFPAYKILFLITLTALVYKVSGTSSKDGILPRPSAEASLSSVGRADSSNLRKVSTAPGLVDDEVASADAFAEQVHSNLASELPVDRSLAYLSPENEYRREIDHEVSTASAEVGISIEDLERAHAAQDRLIEEHPAR